jgi:hypothetical protein
LTTRCGRSRGREASIQIPAIGEGVDDIVDEASLAMASSFVIGLACDLHDLDGPLLFEHDRPHGMKYSGGVVSPPCPDLWG